jgi:hypothetical protein
MSKTSYASTGFRYIYDINGTNIRLCIRQLGFLQTFTYSSNHSREWALNTAILVRKRTLEKYGMSTEFLEVPNNHTGYVDLHTGVYVSSCGGYYVARVSFSGKKKSKSFNKKLPDALERALVWRKSMLLQNIQKRV